MFEKLRRLLASVLIIAILFPALAYGQGASQQATASATGQSTPGALATGTHPLGSYGGSSFDQVNLFNGNLSMTFPLAALGGRAGTGGGISLSYNSKIWQVVQRTISNSLGEGDYFVPAYEHWDKERPILAPGWSFHVGRMMGRHSSWKEEATNTNYTLTTLTFSAPDGTEYSFRDDLTNGQPLVTNSVGNSQSRGKRFHTADGTAAIFVSDTEIVDQFQRGVQLPFSVDGVVVLRDGTRFIISRGKVKEHHDSNGNIVRYSYQGSRLTQITDTLGRQINIEYVEATPDPTNENLFSIKVTSPGFGNSPRTTTIKFAPLANALVGQGGSYTQAETLKRYVNEAGMPNSGLFPDLDPPSSANEFFNPNIIKEITLPSGHKWNFRYNSYGEVVLVETPNLGAIEYRMEQSNGPIIAGSANKQEIFRRASARRLWPRAADRVANLAPESKSTYSDPSLVDSNNIPIPVRQRTFSGENTRIASSLHYYKYSPLENLTPGTGVPPKSGYSPWMEGKEIKTEELTLDTEAPKRVTEYVWEQREGISWIPGANKTFLEQPENDPRIKETTTRYLDSGQVFRTTNEYQDDVFINGVGPFGFNNVIATSVYDGANLLQKTVRTYVTDAEYLKYNDDPTDKNKVINPHIVSLVKTESVLSPNGTEETKVEYEYDNYTRDPLMSRTFSVATSHNANFGTSYIKRGNVTAVTAGLGTSQTQTDRTTVFSQYDIAGNSIKTTGPKPTQIVTTDYDPQHFAFPIASRQTIPELTREFKTESTFDVATGLVTSSKDFNQQTTSYFYQDPDSLDRLTKVVRPTGSGETRYTYSSPGVYPAFVKVDSSLDNTRDLSATSFVDGFLKTIKQQSLDVNNDFVMVETQYDGLSRASKIINPRRLAVTNATTDGYTITTYDELGRISTVNTFDSNNSSTGIVTSTYSGTTITVTDQAGKQRRSKTDALGRLTEVLEPTSTGALTQSTTYDYDSRGNLTQVHQGVQNRTFVYDSLSRLISNTIPETGVSGNGITSYEYDIASNLTKRTDPRGIVTSYTYDTLNRLLTRTYSDTTPAASYFYDGNLPNIAPAGFTPQFAMGRTTAVITQPTSREQATGLFHTYDNVGRITRSIQLLDSKYYTTSSQYNLASLPTSHTYPSGREVTHSYNIAGQLTDVMTNNSPISQGATYTPAGAIESHRLGNGLYHQMKYNSRLQPTKITLGSASEGSASENYWKQEYNYGNYDLNSIQNASSAPSISTNESQNNGNIGYIRITPGNGQSPFEQFFVYDELNRLKLAKEFATPPNAPSNLTIDTSSPYTFPLMWDDNSDNESGFIIERSREGAPFQIVGVAVANQNFHFDGPVNSEADFETSFCYRVRAYFGTFDFSNPQNLISSQASNVVCATTGPQPPDPCDDCDINPDPVLCDCCDADGCISPRKRIGSGLPGYKGDSKSAIDAQLFGVSSLSITPNGDIYIADTLNKVIRKVDNNLIISTAAGNGNNPLSEQNSPSATSASLSSTTSIAINPKTSELFFLSNNLITKFSTSTNKLSVFAGYGRTSPSLSSSVRDSNLGFLSAIDFDNQGNLYLLSQTNNNLSQFLKIDSNGKILSIFGKDSPSSNSSTNVKDFSFSTINTFAVDKNSGDIYFALAKDASVKKISSKTGEISTVFGGGKEPLNSASSATNLALDQFPSSLLISPNGELYVATSKANTKASIYLIKPDSSFKLFAGGEIRYPSLPGQASPISIIDPKGMALDQNNNLYVADSSTHQILFLSKDPSKANSSFSDNSSLVQDPINPLAEPSTSSWSQLYSYDRYGNRLSVDGTNAQQLDISDTNNRITTSGYSYDPAGNLKSDTSGSFPKFYFYDAENRLIKVASDSSGTSTIADYFYDANGWRVKKVLTSPNLFTLRFVYSAGGTLLAEYDGESSTPDLPLQENIYAPSGLLAIIRDNQPQYLTTDHLGSVRLITYSDASIIRRHDFFPFGESIEDTNVGGRSAIPGYLSLPDSIRQKFTGYERDDESGLDFAKARYHGSTLGRFTSIDPAGGEIESPQTLNRYTYVTNNPINYIDPFGLWKIQTETFYKKNKTGYELDKNGNKIIDRVVVYVTKSVSGDDGASLAKQLGLTGKDAEKVASQVGQSDDIRLSDLKGVGNVFREVEQGLTDQTKWENKNGSKLEELAKKGQYGPDDNDCSGTSCRIGLGIDMRKIGTNVLDPLLDTNAMSVDESNAQAGDIIRYAKGDNIAQHFATFIFRDDAGKAIAFSKSGEKGPYEIRSAPSLQVPIYGNIRGRNKKDTGYYRKR